MSGKKKKKKLEDQPAVKQESASDIINRMIGDAERVAESLRDAYDELKNGDLSEAANSVSTAMDILGGGTIHERVDVAADLIDEKINAIEELKSELL